MVARPALWGALLLLVRPAYVVAELLVARAAQGGYSLVSDSVSRLGEMGCSASYCSPRAAWMNGSFVVFGALLAIGALLLRRRLGPGGTVLLVVSGLSSVATGLAPLDRDPTLHALAAAPLFVSQPAALVLLGLRTRGRRPLLGRCLLVTGVVTGAAAVGFVAAGNGTIGGAMERLALWPVLLALAAYAWTQLGEDDGGRTGPPRDLPAPAVCDRGILDPGPASTGPPRDTQEIRMPRRRSPLSPLLASATLLVAVALSACGGDSEAEHPDGHADSSEQSSETPSDTPSASESESDEPEESGTRIEIERSGDTVTPSGERVEVPVGEPITLVVTADAPGELHVHSTPEQEIAYEPGTSEHEVIIDRPGVVEVESHEPHLVVLQLEVR